MVSFFFFSLLQVHYKGVKSLCSQPTQSSLENLGSLISRGENKSFFSFFFYFPFVISLGSTVERKTWFIFKGEDSRFMENSQAPGNI